MPSIQTAWQWAVDTCNAPNVGYSQTYRDQQTIDGITYYDCSSFIWYALVAGGFPLSGYPFATATMVGELLQIGFTYADINGLWVAGDIVWRDGHCEMVYSGSTGYGITMGAHSSNLPLADQVSINSNPSYASSYTYLLRYTGGIPARQWLRGTHGQYFTQSEMENNALCVRDWCVTYTDWSLQAIAAMVANMQGESTLNPDSMERPNQPIGVVGVDGIGLTQWTTDESQVGNPLFVYLDYLYGTHTDWGDPDRQMHVICDLEYGIEQGTYPSTYVVNGYTYHVDPWIPNVNISFYNWAHSTSDPGDLANTFRLNYERGVDPNMERPGWARSWYQFFLNNPYIPPSPVPGRRKGMPLWMMIRYRY